MTLLTVFYWNSTEYTIGRKRRTEALAYNILQVADTVGRSDVHDVLINGSSIRLITRFVGGADSRHTSRRETPPFLNNGYAYFHIFRYVY